MRPRHFFSRSLQNFFSHTFFGVQTATEGTGKWQNDGRNVIFLAFYLVRNDFRVNFTAQKRNKPYLLTL